MVNLTHVGFFSDLPYGQRGQISLRNAPRVMKEDEVTKIIKYLKSGVPIIVAPGSSRDIFDPTKIIGSLKILTDGVFAWPSDFIYYVEKYHIEVPIDFARHMAENDWEVGAVNLKDIIF